MAIQNRRGAEPDFDASKMLPGEFAVTTDGTRKVYAAFAAGDVKELASKEEVQNIIDNFTANVDNEITNAKNEIIEETEEQLQAVINKGKEVLDSIPDDYEEASSNARESVRTKADAIVCVVSGTSAVATDSSDDYARNLKLYGKTTQLTTNGYQLCALPDVEAITNNGITWSCKDGVVTVKGSSTNASLSTSVGITFNITGFVGTYYISGTRDSVYTCVYRKKADGTIDYPRDTSFDLDGTETNVYIYLQILSERTVDATIYPMLNEGTEALPWEPYTNGASPNPDYPQELESVGKWGNLFDKDNATNILYDSDGDSVTNVNFAGCMIDTTKEKTLTVSGCSASNSGVFFSKFDESGNYLGYATVLDNRTFTVSDDCAKVYIASNVSDLDVFMVNYGTTALPYRPYSGQMEIENAVHGGNLFNPTLETTTTNGITITNNGNGTYTLNGSNPNAYVQFTLGTVSLQKGTYKIVGNVVSNNEFYLSGYMIHDKGSGALLTLEEDVINKNVFYFIPQNTTLNNVVIKPMFTKNLDATYDDFEPYTKQSHINLLGTNGLPGIPLGTTIPDVIANSEIHMAGVYWDEEEEQYYISDTVENENRERVVRTIPIILDGSRTYAEFNNYFRTPYTGLLAGGQGLCSHGIVEATYPSNGIYYNAGFVYLRFNDYGIAPSSMTVNELTEYLTGNPIELLAVLAEPYTEPLTASEIESFKALHSNYHTTTVMNDCDAHMDFGYNADTKCYIDNKFAELAAKLIS